MSGRIQLLVTMMTVLALSNASEGTELQKASASPLNSLSIIYMYSAISLSASVILTITGSHYSYLTSSCLHYSYSYCSISTKKLTNIYM